MNPLKAMTVPLVSTVPSGAETLRFSSMYVWLSVAGAIFFSGFCLGLRGIRLSFSFCCLYGVGQLGVNVCRGHLCSL